MVERTGHCSCKSIKYQLKAEPMFTHVCHCSICKRHTGSAFVTHVFIETEHLEILRGEVEAVPCATTSGGAHMLHRCPDCHSPLYSHYGGNARIAVLKGGTLDDPGSVAPGAHIWVEGKVPWITIPDDVPAFDQDYEAAEVWPESSFARRKRAGWG